MSYLFLFREKDSDDRDCCAYIDSRNALDIMPTTVLIQKQAIDNYFLNNKERNVSKKTEKVSESLKSKK